MNKPEAQQAVDASVMTRAAFEAWISAPPFEREVKRFGENSAWPGNYRKLDVDLAWCAWSAAMALASQRVRQLEAAEEGAAEAFGVVVQDKRDLEAECHKLRELLDSAYAQIRRLHDLVAACEPYLKEGETPAERIKRERGDTEAVCRLYAKEREKNVELLEALKLALSAHGTMLLSDPPQEAWKTYGVEQKARAAIARAEGKV